MYNNSKSTTSPLPLIDMSMNVYGSIIQVHVSCLLFGSSITSNASYCKSFA